MPGLAELLASRREDILQRFERAVREWLPTEGLSRSAVIDSLPELLDQIQRALRQRDGQRHEPSAPCHEESTAREHGAQRLSLGFDVARLVHEYALLRTTFFEVLREAGGAPDLGEQQALHHCIDLALGDAAAAHKRLRDEERRQVEQEREALLAREQAARAEAEEALVLLDILLATAPVGLAFLDRELRYVRINHALAAINGVPMERTLGRAIREVVPELASQTEPLYQRVLDTGEPVLNLEVTGTTPGTRGDTGHWLVSYYPVKDREGRTFLVGAVVVDITERKRYEEHLRQTADFRERFLGIVSHDLRNPLGTISLSANHLLRREALPERATRAVQRIANNAEQMARMIGDLLDLTRGRLGGGIPITPLPTDLDLLGRRVLGELEAAHPTRELRLEAEGDLRGEWDADRLAQLIGNLLKNALDYSPEGTPVTLSLRDAGEQVLLEVHNLGEPIPAELLPLLFEPFRQGTRQTRSGLGLGLYIVQQIASAHGGTVEVRSTREDGTRLSVRLPRVSPPRT